MQGSLVLAAMVSAQGVSRAYVNNGGDIGFHVGPGEKFRVGIANDTGDYTKLRQTEDDALARLENLWCTAHGHAAEFGKRCALFWRDIKADNLTTGLSQSLRNGQAHEAEADEAYGTSATNAGWLRWFARHGRRWNSLLRWQLILADE